MSAYTYPDPADPRHRACIVLGCRQRVLACCYTRHGRTAYCADHDPIRLGMALPYVYPARRAAAPVETPQAPPRPNIGPQPPVRPISPPKAPTPTGGARIERQPIPADLVSLEF